MSTDMAGYSAPSQFDDKLALELLEEHGQTAAQIFSRIAARLELKITDR